MSKAPALKEKEDLQVEKVKKEIPVEKEKQDARFNPMRDLIEVVANAFSQGRTTPKIFKDYEDASMRAKEMSDLEKQVIGAKPKKAAPELEEVDAVSRLLALLFAEGIDKNSRLVDKKGMIAAKEKFGNDNESWVREDQFS